MIETGIYQIQSSVHRDRLYIGSASNIMQRWGNHLKTLRINKHRNCKLQAHYNKYGEHDLLFSILEHCGKHALLHREQYYLDLFNPSFNICKKAGSPTGIKWSEESKRKLSERQKGRKLSEEHKKKIGIGSLGHKLSEEAKKKIGEAAHKRRHSEETKLKISKNRKGKHSGMEGKHLSDETKQKLRNANLGKKQSEETINKRMEKLRGKHWTEEMKDKMRKPKSKEHAQHIKDSWILRKQKIL